MTGSRGGEGGAFEGADGIVGIDSALALGVDSCEDIEGVVGEEAFVVEGVAEHLCDGGGGHWLSVIVCVDLRQK